MSEIKSDIKNLFLKKFNDFLKTEEKFFKTYKKFFIISFLQLLKKNYPQIKITKNTKTLCLNFYESLFIEPSFKTGYFKDIIEMKNYLEENNIDLNLINKTFLLMSNHYIKFIFNNENIEKLKHLTFLLDFYYKFLKSQIKIQKETFPLILENIFKEKSNIFLFGVYKGVPLSTKTKILSLDKENKTITVKANNYQLIASNFQKEIYLLDLKTNKTFKAIVIDSIFHEKKLILSEIEEIKRTSLKRNYIRVQPKEKIKINIQINDKNYFGTIYDISLKGISILTKEKIPIHISDFAKITFTLNTKETFTFSAELRSISKYNENYRYHFYFEPTVSEENKLEKYISNREKEIIFELNEYLNKEFIEI